jgi:hypothetical protein
MNNTKSNDPYRIWSRIKHETRTWLSSLTLLFGIFILIASATSLFNHFLGWPLLPVFQGTLDGFRLFTHLILDKTIYSPLLWIIRQTLAVLLTIYSFFSSEEFSLPHLSVPSWILDFGAVSIILLRAQTRAMSYSAPYSTLTLSQQDALEWNWALLNARGFYRIPIKICWTLVLCIYRLKKLCEFPFRYFHLEKLAQFVGVFVGGALMLGIVYFIHDLFSALATRYLSSPRAVSHRHFVTWTIVSLCAAVIASLMFLALNGFMLSP